MFDSDNVANVCKENIHFKLLIQLLCYDYDGLWLKLSMLRGLVAF